VVKSDKDVLFHSAGQSEEANSTVFRSMLSKLETPFRKGDRIGIKLHWGERGNLSHLPPSYAQDVVQHLKNLSVNPFVFDTTVLYSGGRRTGEDSLNTAAEHGYSEAYLDCPVVIADGMDGRKTVDLPGFKHFKTIQVADIFDSTDGFFILSHFKGHMVTGFGGAIKNLSMGFASRAQKQRMHADAHPVLNASKCTRCGLCTQVCPTGAAQFGDMGDPVYDLETCIGCAQCIGVCSEEALRIFWNIDNRVFLERVIETAAAVWNKIKDRTVLINVLLNISVECDCFPGHNPLIAPDIGFVGGYHPVMVDHDSLVKVGKEPFEKAHPGLVWNHQFNYAKEISFI
jgi:uncharacterized Fe-S center protein